MLRSSSTNLSNSEVWELDFDASRSSCRRIQDLVTQRRPPRRCGCPRRRQGLPERTKWRSRETVIAVGGVAETASVEALDEAAIERHVAEVAGKQAA
jgi:hypothetical protein